MSKLISKLSNFWHPENIYCISIAFEVMKLFPIFKEDKFQHSLNIYCICIADEVLKFCKFK